MANRIYNIAAVLSAIAFCLISLAWLIGHRIQPRDHHLSLSADCHVGVDALDADGRLVIFNDPTYGPYRGSILHFNGAPNAPMISGYGDRIGVYYRMIRWPTGESLWTLSVSLAYLLLLFFVLPFMWIINQLRRRRRS